MIGQAVEAAQIAQHHFAGNIGADADHLEVHDGADLVVVVGTRRINLRPLLGIARAQGFIDDFLRQVVGQFRQFIRVQVIDRGEQLFAVHRVNQAFAHRVRNFQQDFAVFFRRRQMPDQHPFFLRQRFEDVGDVRRVQFFQQQAQVGKGKALRGVVRFAARHDVFSGGHQVMHQAVNQLHIGGGAFAQGGVVVLGFGHGRVPC